MHDLATCRDLYERHFGFRPAFDAEGGLFARDDEGFLPALIPAARIDWSGSTREARLGHGRAEGGVRL